MKFVLCVLALSLSMKSFSQNEFTFYPKGNFIVTVTNAGAYYFTDFQFQNGNIYSNDSVLYGTIEKLISEIYAFKISSSIGTLLSSLEKYEIFDEQGLFLGQVRGNFSADSSFLFFDSENRPIAKAILDPSCSEITIRSSDDNLLATCSRTFNYPGFTTDPDYYWTIQATSSSSLDPRYLWPFVALVSEFWWKGNQNGYY